MKPPPANQPSFQLAAGKVDGAGRGTAGRPRTGPWIVARASAGAAIIQRSQAGSVSRGPTVNRLVILLYAFVIMPIIRQRHQATVLCISLKPAL